MLGEIIMLVQAAVRLQSGGGETEISERGGAETFQQGRGQLHPAGQWGGGQHPAQDRSEGGVPRWPQQQYYQSGPILSAL